MTPKRLTLYIVLFLICLDCASAILPEGNVDQTVQMLYEDLQEIKEDIEFQRSQYEEARKDFWEQTSVLEDELDKAAIVLHSQNEASLFGLAQATQIAHDATAKFKNHRKSFEFWFEDVNASAQNINDIRKQLKALNKENLSPEGLKCLDQSIQTCDSIEQFYNEYKALIAPDKAKYTALERRVSDLEESTHKTLNDLYNYIFVKGNEPYVDILKRYDDRFVVVNHDVANRVRNANMANNNWQSSDKNYWDNISTLLSLIIAISLFIAIKRQKKWPKLKQYASTWGMIAFFAFNILTDILTIIFVNPPSFVVKDITIYIQFDLFASLILILQIVRGSKLKLRYLVLLYGPLLAMTWIIISSISELLPLSYVVMGLPIFYIIILLAQTIVLAFIYRKIGSLHNVISLANIVCVTICLIIDWNGWAVASIILLLTWISLLGFILIVYLLKQLIEWKISKHQSPLLDYTMRWLINPILLIWALGGSAYWVSNLFNLTSWFIDWLLTPFVDLPDVCTVSFAKLLSVVQIGLIVNYVIHTTKYLLLSSDPKKYGSGRAAVVISMGTILMWLGYAIAVIVILQINHKGIIAAIGGASVGLGFAMRDTFENFFYGLTMMAGRARPGDIVECDGIRGHIKEVGIISTSIETEDGPIVSLPNRQLFGRNFSNLTLNNRREVRHIIFDISDKNDIEKARRIMLEAAKGIDGVVDYEKHYVVMKHTSCGIVRLDYKCWIDSERYLRAEPAVREAIFNAFKANGIEIAELLQTLDLKASSNIMNPKNKSLI